MAGMVLGAIGAVVGFFTGIGPQLGWMIGSTLGGMIAGSGQKQEGPRLSDLRPQGSEYGRAIPQVFGTQGIAGNVIWAADLIETSSTSGGKGGGPEITNYTYYAHFAVMICEGPVQFGHIWAGADKRVIWDGATLEGGGAIRFYSGTEDQLPDPLMESYLGAGNVPAYRGFSYIVFERFPVANDGNRIPFLTVEVGKIDQASGPSIGSGSIVESFANDNFGTYVVVLNGGYTGVVVKAQSGHGLIASFPDDYVDPVTHAVTHGIMQFNGGPGQNFLDTDRNRLCRVTPAGGFCFMNLSDGTITFANGGYPGGNYNRIPSNGDPRVGTIGIGGVYKDGVYWIFCSGSSEGRMSLNAIHPDSLANVGVAMTDATGIDGSWSPRIYSGANGDGRIIAFRNRGVGSGMSTYNRMTVFAIAAGMPWADLALAPGVTSAYGIVCAQVHPQTKILMAAYMDSGTGILYTYGYDLNNINGYALTAGGGDITTPFAFDGMMSYPGNPTGPGDSPHSYLPLNPFVVIPRQLILSALGGYYTATDAMALIVSNNNPAGQYDYVVRFALPGSGFPWEIDYSPGVSVTTGHPLKCGFTNAADGRVWFGRDPLYFDTTPADASDFSSISLLSSGPAGSYHSLLDSGGVTIAGERLDAVVASLCRQAGLTDAQLDVSDLASDTVDGYTIATQTTVRDAITPLQMCYYFDGVESNGKLKFVKRGKAISLTIPDSDLAPRSVQGGSGTTGDTSTEDMLTTTRMMDAELPHTVTVQYVSAATQYTAATQYARRLVQNSVNEEKVDLPLVLSDQKAAEVAQINLHLPWARRRSYKWKLPKSYCELEPTDLVSVKGNTIFVTKASLSGGVIELEGVFDDFNYTPHVVVSPTANAINQVEVLPLTAMELM
jgi:hypothetical protein